MPTCSGLWSPEIRKHKAEEKEAAKTEKEAKKKRKAEEKEAAKTEKEAKKKHKAEEKEAAKTEKVAKKKRKAEEKDAEEKPRTSAKKPKLTLICDACALVGTPLAEMHEGCVLKMLSLLAQAKEAR